MFSYGAEKLFSVKRRLRRKRVIIGRQGTSISANSLFFNQHRFRISGNFLASLEQQVHLGHGNQS